MKREKFAYLLLVPGFIVLGFLIIYPLLRMIVTGFLQWNFINPIKFIGLENYRTILLRAGFWESAGRSLVFATGATGLSIGVGWALAANLSRIKWNRRLFLTLSILPWAVPLVASAFIWKWMFNPQAGIFNYLLINMGIIGKPLNIFGNSSFAMIGCFIASAYFRGPFCTVLILAGYQSIPKELYESAKIDGANIIRRFKNISVPLVRNHVVIAATITFMFTYRTPDVIIAMTGGGPGKATYVLGYYIFDLVYKLSNYGLSATVGTLLLILTMAWTIPILYKVMWKE